MVHNTPSCLPLSVVKPDVLSQGFPALVYFGRSRLSPRIRGLSVRSSWGAAAVELLLEAEHTLSPKMRGMPIATARFSRKGGWRGVQAQGVSPLTMTRMFSPTCPT